MSWQATRWARDQRTGSVAAKAILFVLAEHVGEDASCFLSVTIIAERAELRRSAVIKHLAAMEAAGLIVRSRRNDQFGHRTSDLIELRLDAQTQGPSDGLRASIQSPPGRPRKAVQGPRHEPRSNPKVHETASLGPPDGPYLVSEKKDLSMGVEQDGAKPSRRKPETPIPDAFPDGTAVERERAYLREKGWNIDASREAEKFRAHALSKDRRLRDWSAAFRQWIIKAIEFAPESAKVAPVITWAQSGPEPWDMRVREFRGANAYWNTDWGPRPGKPGCMAPVDVLASFGFVDGVEPIARNQSAA